MSLLSDIVTKAAGSVFNKPLITNVYRAVIVEAIVDTALGGDWSWCSADYAGWDFEHVDGTRLEVKQSSARQSWAPPPKGGSVSSFDIAERTGWWDGAVWRPGVGRHARIYVFAHHPVIDDTADHRDPEQWRFYVVAASSLPSTKRIGLSALQRLTPVVLFHQLAEAVARSVITDRLKEI